MKNKCILCEIVDADIKMMCTRCYNRSQYRLKKGYPLVGKIIKPTRYCKSHTDTPMSAKMMCKKCYNMYYMRKLRNKRKEEKIAENKVKEC